MNIESNVMNIIAAATKRMEDRIATLERQNAALRDALKLAEAELNNLNIGKYSEALGAVRAALEAK